MRLETYRWLAPVPAALLLQFVFGGFYASGVFTSRLHSPTLTYALGLASLTVSGALTATSLLLHKYPPPTSHRTVAFVASTLLLSSGLLPTSNTLLQFSAAAMLGASYGAIYTVSIATVQNWVPERAGTATGVSVAAGGAGTLCFVALNSRLLNMLPDASAMRTAAVLQAVPAMVASAALSAPPSATWIPRGAREAEAEAAPLLEAPAHGRLSVHDVLRDPALYIVVLAVAASVGPGFGVVLHGSRMQKVLFGVSPAVADTRFWWITLCGVVARVGTGLLVDAGGGGLPAARGVTVGLLVLQAGAFAAVLAAVHGGLPRMFAAVLGVVYAVFGGGSVMMAVLARSTFAPENTTLAFAMLGMALGMGDYVFSAIVGGCAAAHPVGDTFVLREHIRDYDSFFVLSLVFSAAGCLAGVLIVPGKIIAGEGALGRRIEKLVGRWVGNSVGLDDDVAAQEMGERTSACTPDDDGS